MYNQNYTIRFPKELFEQLKQEAKSDGRSFNGYVIRKLEDVTKVVTLEKKKVNTHAPNCKCYLCSGK